MPPPKFNKFTNTKAGKLKKIITPVPGPAHEPTPDEDLQQFELEICWCVQQLERSLTTTKNLTPKQVEDINKSIRILKSTTQPVIKKRQLMRSSFGDYRSKMQEEERSMSANAGRVQFQAVAGTSKSQFLRKAIIKPSGEEFRFNFQVDKLSTLSVNDSGEGEANPETPPATEDAPAAEEAAATAAPKPALNNFHYNPSDNGFRFNFDSKE